MRAFPRQLAAPRLVARCSEHPLGVTV